MLFIGFLNSLTAIRVRFRAKKLTATRRAAIKSKESVALLNFEWVRRYAG